MIALQICSGDGLLLLQVPSATFTLSEVKLGLIPATISPYVVRRLGAAQSRRYMLTAEPITAQRALELGLVHEVGRTAVCAQCEEAQASKQTFDIFCIRYTGISCF
jgi:enoyl-CoA hydratase/carnithine racemase